MWGDVDQGIGYVERKSYNSAAKDKGKGKKIKLKLRKY